MQAKEKLVWIDLEMTGLDPNGHVILEIATIITDKDLNVLAEGPNLILHQPDSALAGMNAEVRQMHAAHGLLDEVAKSTISLSDAEQQTFDFIKKHCQKDQAVLAGNSIGTDKNFLSKYMPKIIEFLHYRIIDVSTVKLLAWNWYPNIPEFEKKDTHRALEDIKESINELKYYRERIFINSDDIQ